MFGSSAGYGYSSRLNGGGGPTTESLKCQIEDLEWQLKGRISELEQQLAELREACGVVPGRGRQRGGGAGMDLYKDYWLGVMGTDTQKMHKLSDDNSEAGSTWEDSAGGTNITEDDLEDKDGHKFEGSVWDSTVFVGVECLGFTVSLSLAMLIVINMVVQGLLCYLIYEYMLDDPVGKETLAGLLRFRTNEAHSALYADRVRERSLTSQVCDLDAGLHWANSQVALLRDVRNFMQVGTTLCLLATACWLATLLKEAMDTVHFTRALTLRLGYRTVLIHSGGEVVLQKIGATRFIGVVAFCIIPRLIIVGFLLPVGMSYLRYTISPSELVLNAMALTFIIQIDEMFYEAFAPRRVKSLMRNLQSMPVTAFRSGRKSGGMFSTLRMVCLVLGIAGSYIFLLRPFYFNVSMAEKILCSGDQDFIYSVHPSSQVVEVTRSSKREHALLSETQQSLLNLAHPDISSWNQELLSVLNQRQVTALEFPSPSEFGSGAYDFRAFRRILAAVQEDVFSGSRGLVCEDWDKLEGLAGMHIAENRIRALTQGSRSSCSDIDLMCADMNSNAIRALCPLTCGCSNIVDPAAGFFASPSWGCPLKCYTRIKASMGLFSSWGSVHPCDDVAPEEFATRASVQNYIRGFYSFFLDLMESGGISINMKLEVGDLHKHLGIYGAQVNYTTTKILDGTFLRDVTSGHWQFAPGVPHPRGLTGCKFWTSWEVVMVFGTNLCETEDFRSIRMFCPVSCGCRSEDAECPISCPPR